MFCLINIIFLDVNLVIHSFLALVNPYTFFREPHAEPSVCFCVDEQADSFFATCICMFAL